MHVVGTPNFGPTLMVTKTIDTLGNIIIGKSSSLGIKVDTEFPTFGWKDLIGFQLPDTGGLNSPVLATFQGNVRRFVYANSDKMDCEFHIPHDFVLGSDIFLHYHWAHNGTAISGVQTVTYSIDYCKGYNQSTYSLNKIFTSDYDTVNLATTPRYAHIITEVQASTPGGSATLLDSNLLEPDGIIGVNFTMTSIASITGGSGKPFVNFIDIHYQSTQVATKQRNVPFYV